MEFVMITSESYVEESFLLDLGIHGLDFLSGGPCPPCSRPHDCSCVPLLAEWVQLFENASFCCPATVLLFITDLTGSDDWQCNWVKREMLCPAV